MRLPSVGLLGRIVLILAFVLITEFVANTFVFERVSRFALQDDEANLMAEYLVVARRVMDRTPPQDRDAVARELSTPRLQLNWHKGIDSRAARFNLDELRSQMLAIEPKLREAKLRLYLMPLSRGGEVGGSVELSDHTTVMFRAVQPHAFWPLTVGRMLALSVPMILLAVLGGLMIRATLKPLSMLMHATRTLGNQEPVPVTERGPREVRTLIRDFNMMQQRIHRLVSARTQALAAVGHDLRTPLARMELRLHGAKVDEETRAALIKDIGEMSDLLQSLQTYLGGEGDTLPVEKVDIAVMAATIVDAASDAGHDATYDGPSSLEVMTRAVSMRRAISNLVENALHYAGNVRVSVREENGAVLICVEDDGPGIPAEKLDTALQPFVRLDEGRARNTRGMGLGLAIVHNGVRAEGGTLSLTNRSEGGLRAVIRLPTAGHDASRSNISLQDGASAEIFRG
ncbi:two-component system sensor histidine kinase [Sphingobium sp. SYK-6]|uniref:ATP-binding protein n=1 Tax=Sphingobium sp. (strain NBRC 103272 / SYK-6) TaxID=627192 RepID=UPI000227737D|nr:ATP-binding protein [Sphingobium sp. SYK-6]BAK67671.1 two-component system sensor histidine kinase [Sphingobium sp. SYK-6]